MLLGCLAGVVGWAVERQTGLSGIIKDAETGEPMSDVQVYFLTAEGKPSPIGTTSNSEGRFRLVNTDDYVTVEIQMIGYKTVRQTVRAGIIAYRPDIKMEPDVLSLEGIVIRPSKEKKRYKRKGNPAVELMQNVIAHKAQNRLDFQTDYKKRTYTKLTMALDPFDYNLDKNAFMRTFKFLENYIDTSRLDTTPTLHVSIRETLQDDYLQNKPYSRRSVLQANRWVGLDELLGKEHLARQIDAVFQPIDIYDNNISIMANKFVSPISSSGAISFYQYYLQDTLWLDGDTCIDVSFVSVNSESFGFTGHLYIVKDSTYALKKYNINVPPVINVNFLKSLALEQSFQRLDNGAWVPLDQHSYSRMSLTRKSKHDIFAHQMQHYDGYELGVRSPDSLFVMAGNVIKGDSIGKHTPEQWNTMRPVPLDSKERLIAHMTHELLEVPQFRALVTTANILINEFVPTTEVRDSSKWDFGPIFNTISYNEQEGVRLRVGGTTTANVNKRFFVSGYTAYGFNDRRVKGGLNLHYSFHDKTYHQYESLRHSLSLHAQYDIEELGQTYRVLDRDHILMSIKFNYDPKPVQYIGRIRLKYEKEWQNQFSIITWAEFMNNQPNGSGKPFVAADGRTYTTDMSACADWGRLRADRSSLTMQYVLRNADGTYTPRPYYHDAMWTLQLRYSPGGYIYNDRQGLESPYNLWKDAPVFRFSSEAGYILEDRFFYDRLQFTAEKRFWLSAFGHLDAIVDIGYLASKQAPFTKLFIPASNQSILLDPKAFNLMQPMEFMMDRYVSWHLTYYLKGWLFNRIPLLKKMRLREVISFHGLAGYLADRHNPYKTDGLYEFPHTYSLNGKPMPLRTDFADRHYNASGEITKQYNYMPYMELTVGIENIFNLIRIEYVRRLTHLEPEPGMKLGPWQRNSVRFIFRAAL